MEKVIDDLIFERAASLYGEDGFHSLDDRVFILALAVEVILRMVTKRTIMKQTEDRLLSKLEQYVKDDFKKITGA